MIGIPFRRASVVRPIRKMFISMRFIVDCPIVFRISRTSTSLKATINLQIRNSRDSRRLWRMA